MTKAKPLPTLKRIEELLNYDQESGDFFWKRNQGRLIAGSKAGTSLKGYINITIDYVKYPAHRLAWFLVTGTDPKDCHIDHIDNNKINNKFSNLRLASNSQNVCNQPATKRNSSGFKGVSYNKQKNKWIAVIHKNYKQHYLGYFDTPELAHMAYCKAAAELHGEFARGQ